MPRETVNEGLSGPEIWGALNLRTRFARAGIQRDFIILS